jgi:hypothetical protein
VKHLNLKIINLLIIMLLLFSFRGISQNTQVDSNSVMGTINASGNNASGSTGTVTYSIGQVFYTYIGESVYNVAQGIQHEEINTILATKVNVEEPKTEIVIFPNPTTDYVNINMSGVEFYNGQQSYQLYDIQGRLLKQDQINQAESQINLTDLSSSLYILQIHEDNKVLKTFKIVKK